MTSTGTIESGSGYENALVKFFNKWPEFDYQGEEELIREFGRLCREKQWSREERQEAKNDLRDAMVERFNEIYGTYEEDLEAWKKLCRDVHVDPIPDTLAECEKAIYETHVNLVDLIDNRVVKRFDTLEELVEYTIENSKYFPKENAYAGGLLRNLLREINSGYFGKKRRGSTDGHGRGRGRGGRRRGGRGGRDQGGSTR